MGKVNTPPFTTQEEENVPLSGRDRGGYGTALDVFDEGIEVEGGRLMVGATSSFEAQTLTLILNQTLTLTGSYPPPLRH